MLNHSKVKQTKENNMKFKWTKGAHLAKFDPNVIGARLNELTSRGQLTAQEVVSDARDPTSPLHDLFEWDDAKAAEEQRLNQARYIIRSVRLVVERGGRRKPKIVRVRTFLRSRRAYVLQSRILRSRDLLNEALREVVAELRAIERKYEEYRTITKPITVVRRRLENRVSKKRAA